MTWQLAYNFLLRLFEFLTFIFYAKSFFDKKYSYYKICFLSFLGYVSLFLVYELGIVYLNIAAFFVVNALLIFTFFECDFKSAIFHSAILQALMLYSEWIVIIVMSVVLGTDIFAFQTDFKIFVIGTILNKLAYYCMCVLIVKVFAKEKISSSRIHGFWALMIVPLTSVVALLFLYQLSMLTEPMFQMKLGSSIVSLLLFLSNIVVFAIYDYSIKNFEELFELRSINYQKEVDKQYLEIIEKNNDDLKIFTHDIKNHLKHIASLSEDKRVTDYISNLYGEVDQSVYYGMTKNRTFDVIINKYLTLCERKNIRISFDTKSSNLSFIEDTDLSTILNNLLDNAVESAEKTKDRKIAVSAYLRNSSFVALKITNSCDTPPVVNKNVLMSTKGDNGLHGLGMKSVERAVKRYDGMVEWNYFDDTNMFEIVLVFPVSGRK